MSETEGEYENVPVPYEPTRFQRRCKHPKWRVTYVSRFTRAEDQQCQRCGIMRTVGGLLNFQFGAKP